MKASRVIPYEGVPRPLCGFKRKVSHCFYVFRKLTSLQESPNRGKEDLDCRHVRVHHKPTRLTDTRGECRWVKVKRIVCFPALKSQKSQHVIPPLLFSLFVPAKSKFHEFEVYRIFIFFRYLLECICPF